MTGSLQEKNGKFYMVINTKQNGKRKLKWIATGLAVKGNKRKAEQMLRETLQTLETRPKVTTSDILFSDYIRVWLNNVRRRVDEVTYQGYEILALRHLIPWFKEKGVKLTDVTVELLQEYVDEKFTKGRTDGKGGLSPSSIRRHKNIMNQTLTEAVKNGLLTNNPCQYIDLPKSVRYESHYYTAKQLNELFEAIRDEPRGPLLKITAIYGLRRSEVLGLKWDSINFEAGTVTIRHTVSGVTKAVEKDKTKNTSSYRSFPLTEEARQIFLAAKEAEEENRRLFRRQYQDNSYVFKWDDGTPYRPDYITAKFSDLLKQHGLPHIRLHELRHSCASLLINEGFGLKDVQDWMGHADIKMTANIYGHLDVARKQTMAEKLSGSLSGVC